MKSVYEPMKTEGEQLQAELVKILRQNRRKGDAKTFMSLANDSDSINLMERIELKRLPVYTKLHS